MNWINAKAMAVIVGAAVVAGTGTYFVSQSEVSRLRDENQQLLTQQAALTAEAQAAQTAVQSSKADTDKLRQDANDVLRLRSEVAQLRRQQAEAQRTAQQPKPSQSTQPSAQENQSTTFTREQMAYVGYATPEAALQTIVWATMSGNLSREQIEEGLSPTLLKDQEAYSVFERNRQQSQGAFKSVDMLAKKTLDDNRVEFKAALNVDLGPNAPAQPPSVMVLPMEKIEGRWKLASNPKEYKQGWDDGQVHSYRP